MATWLSGVSKQHRIIRKNVFLWYGVFLAAFALVIARLAWLQLVEFRFYQEQADALHKRSVTLRHERGKIFDRNAVVLAMDDQRQSLYVDASLVPYPGFLAEQLAPVIQEPVESLLAKLTERTIASDLMPNTAERIRQMSLPGIMVKSQGIRLRIGADWQAFQPDIRTIKRIAGTLGISAEQVREELGAPAEAEAGAAEQPVQPRPTGQRWLQGMYPARAKNVLAKMRIAGLLYESSECFTVTVDQRLYAGDKTASTAKYAAEQLATTIPLSREAIEKLLVTRSQYIMLKPNLTENTVNAIQRLQATMYVAQPGKLYDSQNPKDVPEKRAQEAVMRLLDMLNEKDKPPVVTAEQIRARLVPGAEPGVLGIKYDGRGQPDLTITRRLFAKPIPGVTYGLPGIGFQREPSRHYPYGKLAAATLGWVGDVRVNPHGVFGIEKTEEDLLKGVDGKELKEIDARRRTIPERSSRTEAVNGKDAMLTLDLSIQQIVEEELAKAVKTYRALQGACIVMDNTNGEILAMANYPTWDANYPDPNNRALPLVNPLVSNFYEPGSTFKVVAVTAALEEKKISDGQTVIYCSGAMPIGRRTIHEAHHAHGTVDCSRLLEQSCNIGAASLAMRLGPDTFLKWCEKFGFGQKTGIELDNESPGSLNRKNATAKITLANMGFGQSLAVTPVQMAAAYSALVNGGEWIQPHLLKARRDANGEWKEITDIPRHRVCSPETSTLLRNYLERVITNGTGTTVAIPGYRIGGKTGTAQKPGPHGYRSGKYIGSFIGVMPIDNPRLTIITVIDEPSGAYYGGVVAGPVVHEVGKRTLQYLNIPPSQPTGATTSRH